MTRTKQTARKSGVPFNVKYSVMCGKQRHRQSRIWNVKGRVIVPRATVLESYADFKNMCPAWFKCTQQTHELAKEWLFTEDGHATYIKEIHLCRFSDNSTCLLTDADVYVGELTKIRMKAGEEDDRYEGRWLHEGQLSDWCDVDTSNFDQDMTASVLLEAKNGPTDFPAGLLKHCARGDIRMDTETVSPRVPVPFQFKRNNCLGAAVLNSGILTTDELLAFEKRIKPFMFLKNLGAMLKAHVKGVMVVRKRVPKTIEDYLTCRKGVYIVQIKQVVDGIENDSHVVTFNCDQRLIFDGSKYFGKFALPLNQDTLNLMNIVGIKDVRQLVRISMFSHQ